MFGMGGSEILVILIVALLFLGPDKLPDAATKISKGIRDLRKQTREIQQTIENDTQIGGAIRDLKSALRGEEVRNAVRAAVAPALAEVDGAVKTLKAPVADATKVAADAKADLTGKPASADPAAGSILGPRPEATPAAPDAGEAALAAEVAAIGGPAPAATVDGAPAEAPAGPRMPPAVGEPHDPDASPDDPEGDAELARLVRPAGGIVARDLADDHG